MNEEITVLVEAIEHTSEVAKLFTTSEIALNDGDAEGSQKYTKMAQQLFDTMKKDIILEVKEVLGVTCPDVLDYDFQSILELVKFLSEASTNIARYLGIVLSNNSVSTKEILAKKIVNDYNTAIEIYDLLFNN